MCPTVYMGAFFLQRFVFIHSLKACLKSPILGKMLERSKREKKVLEKLKDKGFSRQEAKCEEKGVGNAFCLEYQDLLQLPQAQRFFTLIFMVLGARAVISFCMRSAIPGYIVVPPDKTLLAYRSLRISMSHFMMLL